MTTAATAPATGTPAATPDATTLGKNQLATSFNTFLTLLTTQLKNQDPLSPLDSNQFTQQLVQMSGVQAQLTGNGLLQQVATNTSNGISTAVGLIGKTAKVTSDTADLSGGKAAWTYNLASDATDVKLQVLDSNGKVVHAEAPTSNKAGDHDFTWDGKDLNGAKLADGTYTLKVTALDGAGKTIATSSFVQGRVTSVEQSNGATLITVNGSKVSWDKVVSVTEATTTSPATGA